MPSWPDVPKPLAKVLLFPKSIWLPYSALPLLKCTKVCCSDRIRHSTTAHTDAHTLSRVKAAVAFIFPRRTFLPCCLYMMLRTVLAFSVVLISIMNLTWSASWGTCLKYRLRDPNPQDSDTVSLAEDLYFLIIPLLGVHGKHFLRQSSNFKMHANHLGAMLKCRF